MILNWVLRIVVSRNMMTAARAKAIPAEAAVEPEDRERNSPRRRDQAMMKNAKN